MPFIISQPYHKNNSSSSSLLETWLSRLLAIANSVLNKSKSAIPLFNNPEVLPSAYDEAKLFTTIFSENSNLHDLGISLPVFPSKKNLTLHNISVTPTLVKKVIANLDLSNVPDPDCIPVVILKNCEPEVSYILAELLFS